MSKGDAKDRVYAAPQDELSPFEFDDRVADVFPDMIRRSVPGYGTVLKMIGVLAREFVKPGTRCYDVGCSLGAATLAIRHNIQHPGCRIIAVDNSEAMVSRCRHIVDRDAASTPVDVVLGDAREQRFENASFVVMNYTLQFLPPEQRDDLIASVCGGLNPGGAMVLSEKIRFDDETSDQLQIGLHHAFKRANGYSELEIAQKRSALENVLIPDTLPAHIKRLGQAGFATVEPWFQCFNFVSVLAIK